MRSIAVIVVALLGCARADLEIGPVDRPAPPRVEKIRPPRDAKGVPRVGLRAVVTGEVKGKKARHLYVCVNPLSNPSNFGQFWIQEPVEIADGRFRCEIQLGEGQAGQGEFFLAVALWTDTEYAVGERLERLPRNGMAYSKALIVKRD